MNPLKFFNSDPYTYDLITNDGKYLFSYLRKAGHWEVVRFENGETLVQTTKKLVALKFLSSLYK